MSPTLRLRSPLVAAVALVCLSWVERPGVSTPNGEGGLRPDSSGKLSRTYGTKEKWLLLLAEKAQKSPGFLDTGEVGRQLRRYPPGRELRSALLAGRRLSPKLLDQLEQGFAFEMKSDSKDVLELLVASLASPRPSVSCHAAVELLRARRFARMPIRAYSVDVIEAVGDTWQACDAAADVLTWVDLPGDLRDRMLQSGRVPIRVKAALGDEAASAEVITWLARAVRESNCVGKSVPGSSGLPTECVGDLAELVVLLDTRRGWEAIARGMTAQGRKLLTRAGGENVLASVPFSILRGWQMAWPTVKWLENIDSAATGTPTFDEGKRAELIARAEAELLERSGIRVRLAGSVLAERDYTPVSVRGGLVFD